ncbi:MAG TPA: 2OG-Fe(II) oxygenase [Candidatus Saccharimonadia bacterium]|nr:2OG-Fe(II) oxygenase [Candidatus Saccharimonadia bacterium]
MNLAESLAPAHHAATPFPHYAVTDALPREAFESLVAAFPPAAQVMQGGACGDNRRYSWSAREALADPALDVRWREFVAAHVSQEFLDGVLAALADDIRAAYPDLEARIGKPIAQWRAGLRRRDTFEHAEVLLDAQICLNTPVVSAPSSVRGPHVDKPNKLFAGLYYLRPPADADTIGGELELYGYRNRAARFDGAEISPDDVVLARTVPYRGNTFVLFLNSLEALHGVTPRQVTPNTRYFFNLVGEIAVPLFDLRARQLRTRGLRRAWKRLKNALAGRETRSGQRYD